MIFLMLNAYFDESPRLTSSHDIFLPPFAICKLFLFFAIWRSGAKKGREGPALDLLHLCSGRTLGRDNFLINPRGYNSFH